MIAEISFDLVMEGPMEFVEGTFRLPESDWQVFIFSRADVSGPVINRAGRWASGVTGVTVDFPTADTLNKDVVLKILSAALNVAEWKEVHGPDSMQLR